jgi:hypothetical protein
LLVITVHLSESDNVVRTGILPISLSDNVDIKHSSGALLIRPLSRSPPAIPRGSHSLVRAEAEREQNPGHRAQTRIDPGHPGSELWPIAASRARPRAARRPWGLPECPDVGRTRRAAIAASRARPRARPPRLAWGLLPASQMGAAPGASRSQRDEHVPVPLAPRVGPRPPRLAWGLHRAAQMWAAPEHVPVPLARRTRPRPPRLAWDSRRAAQMWAAPRASRLLQAEHVPAPLARRVRSSPPRLAWGLRRAAQIGSASGSGGSSLLQRAEHVPGPLAQSVGPCSPRRPYAVASTNRARPRAARAMRWPPPATAGVGSAPGCPDVDRQWHVAIAASRAARPRAARAPAPGGPDVCRTRHVTAGRACFLSC